MLVSTIRFTLQNQDPNTGLEAYGHWDTPSSLITPSCMPMHDGPAGQRNFLSKSSPLHLMCTKKATQCVSVFLGIWNCVDLGESGLPSRVVTTTY